jgi:hypothetical protein
MELNLKDRLLIIKSVLPEYNTRTNTVLKMAISHKLQLSQEENKDVIFTPLGNNQYEIGFKTVEAITGTNSYSFTDDELYYLKQSVARIDDNGMFSEATVDSYDKILDAPFATEEWQAKWDESTGGKYA